MTSEERNIKKDTIYNTGPGQNVREIITRSADETIAAGRRYAENLRSGDIVLLKGDLGAGKTHFVKGVSGYFGVSSDEVQSPTFSLIHEYPGTIPIYHLDCYRLKKPEEALEFGLEEYLYGDGITVIEWPEIIASLLPQHCRTVEFKHVDENKREIFVHQLD